MKLPCRVAGKAALIVGYAPGRKGRPMAMVITQGALKAVRLKDIELAELPERLQAANVVEIPKKAKEALEE